MHHGFATDEEEVADVIADADVDGVPGFLEGDGASGFGIELGTCEPAEVAVGVAEIGDGELEIPGTGVIEHIADEANEAFPGCLYGRGREGAVGGFPWWRGW